MYKKLMALLLLFSASVIPADLAWAQIVCLISPPINNGTILASQSQQNEAFQIKAQLDELRSSNQNEREKARKAILEFSTKSADARLYIIKALIRIAKVPNGNAELMKSNERFWEWKESVDILGIMKATEAIDVLMECLDCNNTAPGLAPEWYPATKAIIKIGTDAIPKLTEAMRHKSPSVRFMAAQALFAIGGDRSKDALEKALLIEKDGRIAFMIKAMLRDWGNSGKNIT